MNDLRNKRALVTGAARGIGSGIALALARAGADVMLHFRGDPQDAINLAEQIGAMGRKAPLCQTDLGSEAGVEKLFADVERVFGGLDIAVNNAGWDPGALPAEEITYDSYQRLSDINIRGTLFCCLHEVAIMRRSPAGGSIINIGSVHQETTVPGRILYAMSKGAIHSFTGALALEAGPQHIRVNNIAPGYIVVERMSSAPGFDRDQIAAGIPLKRLGEPDDVGNMVVFLASDAASFITGQTYVLDGGVSRKLARTAT